MRVALQRALFWGSMGLNVVFLGAAGYTLAFPHEAFRFLVHHVGAPRVMRMGGRHGSLPTMFLRGELERLGDRIDLTAEQHKRFQEWFETSANDAETSLTALRADRVTLMLEMARDPADTEAHEQRWTALRDRESQLIEGLHGTIRRVLVEMTPEQRGKLAVELEHMRDDILAGRDPGRPQGPTPEGEGERTPRGRSRSSHKPPAS